MELQEVWEGEAAGPLALHVEGLAEAIPVRRGATIWEALHAAGWLMRMGCRRGGCGVCQVRCLQGRVRMERWAPSALPVQRQAAGWVLACRAQPVTDVWIAVPPERGLCPLPGWLRWSASR